MLALPLQDLTINILNHFTVEYWIISRQNKNLQYVLTLDLQFSIKTNFTLSLRREDLPSSTQWVGLKYVCNQNWQITNYFESYLYEILKLFFT